MHASRISEKTFPLSSFPPGTIRPPPFSSLFVHLVPSTSSRRLFAAKSGMSILKPPSLSSSCLTRSWCNQSRRSVWSLLCCLHSGSLRWFSRSSESMVFWRISVSLRTPEFGIRIALGSSKVSLIRVVLLEALMPVGGGLALGLLASIAATRAIRSLLYETSAADPASIVVSLGILPAMFVAALLPAYRASRIEPIKVLRAE
jgi:FtsX-like permease family